MKKLLTLIFLFACLNGFSQSFELGTGIGFYRIKGDYIDRFGNIYRNGLDQLNIAFNLLGSGNIPLKKIRNELYFGVNPNASVGYGSNMFTFDIPAYLTLKYGLSSFRDSEKMFGFGVGIGGQFSGFTTRLADSYTGVSFPFSKAYLVPSVMVQVTFEIPNYNVYQIRADVTPIPAEKNKGDFRGTISQYNLMLMRTF
jgi:hypothetical protein